MLISCMRYRNNYVAHFLTCFDVAVRIGSLFQWVTPVDHGFDLARLNQLSEKYQIFCFLNRRLQYDFFAAEAGRPFSPNQLG